jgi:hypothetical protein
MQKSRFVAVAALVFAMPFLAQAQTAKEGTVVTSEAGKASVVQTIEAVATVTGIDKATRTITLKGPRRTVDVVAGDEVRNFDQIKLGERVSVRYQRALSLELRKTRTKPDAAVSELAARAQPGQRPGAVAGRAMTVIADVVAVDPKKSIISLKGPRGNVVDLNVQNPDHFKVVKKGDQVEALYYEAVAIAVTPAPAAPAPAKTN